METVKKLLFYEGVEVEEDEEGEADPAVVAPLSYTESGEFVVFNRYTAGSPSCFIDKGGDWFYEPVDLQMNIVYSDGYPSREAALEAAEEWEEKMEIEKIEEIERELEY